MSSHISQSCFLPIDLPDITHSAGLAEVLTTWFPVIDWNYNWCAALVTVCFFVFASHCKSPLGLLRIQIPSSLTLSGGTANGVLYLNGSKVLTSGSALVFDGTTVLTTPRINITNTGIGATFSSSGGSGMRVYGSSGTNQWDVYLNGANIRFSDNTGGGVVKIDTGAVIDGNLGIGTASPSKKLDIRTNVVGESALMLISNDNTSGTGGSPTVASIEFASAGVAKASIAAAVYGNDWLSFRTGSNTERMRLTSSVLSTDSSISVGIGTASPAAKLHVSNGSNSDSGDFTAFVFGGTDATNSRTGSIIKGTSTPYNTIFRYQNNTGTTTGSLIFQNGSTPQATLDSSGNLGLGVTPSAWTSIRKAIQLPDAGYFATTGETLFLTANAYLDSTSTTVYVSSAYATRYRQTAGQHQWFNAPSGTAGNAISFTQALTLDASGNLAVGTTTVDERLRLNGDSNATSRIRLQNQGTTLGWFGSYLGITALGNGNDLFVANATANALIFGTNGTERARITSGGYSKFSNDGTYVSSTGAYHEFRNTDAAQPILYLTATSGSYTGQTIYINNTRAASSAYKFYSANADAVEQFYVRGDGVLYAQNTTIQSLSDGRLKENVRNATEGLQVVNALRPVRYDWKAGYGNDRKDQLGFIAQEVEAVFPDAVSEWSKAEGDEEAYKTVGPGALIPVLVKAIQELTARVAQLESK